eukprot:Colp12_sorted_trinity150504_noHs@10482
MSQPASREALSLYRRCLKTIPQYVKQSEVKNYYRRELLRQMKLKNKGVGKEEMKKITEELDLSDKLLQQVCRFQLQALFRRPIERIDVQIEQRTVHENLEEAIKSGEKQLAVVLQKLKQSQDTA